MRRLGMFVGVLAGTALFVASAASARPGVDGTADPATLCYKIHMPVCTDCPGFTNNYCQPYHKGPYKSCKPADPIQACETGYCAQVDPGPTGCGITPVDN